MLCLSCSADWSGLPRMSVSDWDSETKRNNNSTKKSIFWLNLERRSSKIINGPVTLGTMTTALALVQDQVSHTRDQCLNKKSRPWLWFAFCSRCLSSLQFIFIIFAPFLSPTYHFASLNWTSLLSSLINLISLINLDFWRHSHRLVHFGV